MQDNDCVLSWKSAIVNWHCHQKKRLYFFRFNVICMFFHLLNIAWVFSNKVDKQSNDTLCMQSAVFGESCIKLYRASVISNDDLC